jgi:uncharacterized protein YdiU (UPF0061 family)
MEMIVHWQRVGFVHGVMNTDNMSIHGETIDYGPYGWLEGIDPDWTPNTTDAGRGRYRYGNQPAVAMWNLQQLASALYPLIQETEPLVEALRDAQSAFIRRQKAMKSAKIGLESTQPCDANLLDELDAVLELTQTDMTIFFRLLADWSVNTTIDRTTEFLGPMVDAFYSPSELQNGTLSRWRSWFQRYQARLQQGQISDSERRLRMNLVNPKYVLRNYMAQLAINKATNGDFSLITELHELLKRPYDEQPEYERWFVKRPDWARHKVGCSMLSCSS